MLSCGWRPGRRKGSRASKHSTVQPVTREDVVRVAAAPQHLSPSSRMELKGGANRYIAQPNHRCRRVSRTWKQIFAQAGGGFLGFLSGLSFWAQGTQGINPTRSPSPTRRYTLVLFQPGAKDGQRAPGVGTPLRNARTVLRCADHGRKQAVTLSIRYSSHCMRRLEFLCSFDHDRVSPIWKTWPLPFRKWRKRCR